MASKCLLFCAVFVLFSGCRQAAVDDFRDDAHGVIDQARDGAEAVAGLSAEELQEQAVAHAVRVAELSVEQLRELWAIEYQTLVVCPLNKLTLDLRGVSTVRAGIAVRRPVRPRASNRKIISGTYH